MRSHAKAASAPSTHLENSTFSLSVIAAMLVCAAAFLGIGAPAASAAPVAGPGWAYQGSFGNFGNLLYEATRSPVAVDGNGNVFSVYEDHTTVIGYTFDPGEGWKVLTEFGGGLPRNVAIDLSDDTVYVDELVSYGGTTVHRYVSDGQPTPTYSVDPSFSVPQGEGMAVDQSTGDLLITDGGAETVRRYNASGTLLATIPTPGIAPAWIATAPDGSFFVAPADGPDVTHFSGAGTLLGTIAGVGSPSGLGYDAAREAVVVAVGEQLKSYSPDGSAPAVSPLKSSSIGLIAEVGTSVLFDRTGNHIDRYVPATIPGVEAPAVSAIGPHSAHLSAEVDPGAGPPEGSTAHFEYSEDGGANWQSTPDQALSGAETIEADITGITVNQEYLARVKASNSLASATSGTTAFSTPETAPEVVTAKATDVTETRAVLNGTINPAGQQTTYYFEYGTTGAYGSKIPAGIEAVAGNGRKTKSFARTITGLQPGTEYHFRLVAKSALGTTEGADEIFTTVPAGGIPHRAYEQVTPADKKGIAIESGYGFYAKSDGEGMAYLTKGGTGSAPLAARAITYRGADDWHPGPDLDPPLAVNNVGIITQTTLGLSADFSRAFVVSNRKLTPDAAENPAASLYAFDIASGKYTLVGSTPPVPFALSTFTSFGVGGNLVAGAPDFSWMVFYSGLPLIEGAPYMSLYRWSEADGLEIVSILPGPSETPATVFEMDDYSRILPLTSNDGSRIYFQSVEPEPGVYLRENGETKAVSVSEVPGEPTGPQPAQFIGTSEDGRYAFFGISKNGVKLTADAPGTFGDAYRYDASDGSLEYLGDALQSGGTSMFHSGLSITPDGETFYFRAPDGTKLWRGGALQTVSSIRAPSELSAGSPNGRYLAFAETEHSPLYFYDSVTDEVTCASCFPDGTPGIAFLPNLINRTIGEHLPQAVTDSGQFFFTSSSRLVAADVNGVNDVYEYKDGKLRLISPGNAPFPATFGDISKNGNDVFFTTQQKLVGRDNDGTVDIYDARIDGGLPAQSPPPPQECIRDDCKATPNAGPELPFGGSEALSGPENVKPPKHKRCGKGKKAKKVKGKVRCVKKHTKHKASKNKKGGNR